MRHEPDSPKQYDIQCRQFSMLVGMSKKQQRLLSIPFLHGIYTQPGREERRVGPLGNQILILVNPGK